ncbi:MAG: tetratricopeptide repeat protein [Phaeodactylibacter sp.]|uniref:tetratricopeptide repeat protein n=1 Tax=Phaeodactylibacter sp. TaxID=1940289 RepID=UPI0032EAD1F6
MKIRILSIALILGSLSFLSAQDMYLPVSTTSKAAKAAYIKGIQATDSADLPTFYEAMNTALKSDPDFFMAYAYLAIAETSFTQYEKAAPHIKSALAIDATGLNKGELILRKALQTLDKDPKADVAKFMASLTDAYPNNAQAYGLAAISASWISKDPQASVKYTQQVIELRPEFGGSYNTLGYNYMALGEMEKAKAAFDKYLELSPNEPNAYDSMGEYYMVAKDYARSAEYYDKAAKMGMELAEERAEKAREAMKAAGN